MTQFRRWACHVAFTVAMLLVALMVYWLSDRSPPFLRYNGEIEPANPRPGQEVEVYWEAEFIRDCPGTVQRTITDAQGNIWTPPASVARYAKRGRTQRQPMSEFRLPPNIACGPAKYEADARYICNWTQNWWPIRVNRPLIYFNIACT